MFNVECLMFKEIKIMKAFRYLLIVMSLVSVLSISAQTLAQQPSSDFRSTSVMQSSGSALPQAAVTGAYMTSSTPGSYTPATRPGGIIRKDVGEGEGTEDEEDPDNPGEPNPLGDAMWPLMLLALMYVCARVFRNKRVRA